VRAYEYGGNFDGYTEIITNDEHVLRKHSIARKPSSKESFVFKFDNALEKKKNDCQIAYYPIRLLFPSKNGEELELNVCIKAVSEVET